MPISLHCANFCRDPPAAKSVFPLVDAGRLSRGLAARIAFALPAAIALILFAYGANALQGLIGAGLLHGLKLVAEAIVAQAVTSTTNTSILTTPVALRSICIADSARHR